VAVFIQLDLQNHDSSMREPATLARLGELGVLGG
jgi:hypothetical protein